MWIFRNNEMEKNDVDDLWQEGLCRKMIGAQLLSFLINDMISINTSRKVTWEMLPANVNISVL